LCLFDRTHAKSIRSQKGGTRMDCRPIAGGLGEDHGGEKVKDVGKGQKKGPAGGMGKKGEEKSSCQEGEININLRIGAPKSYGGGKGRAIVLGELL